VQGSVIGPLLFVLYFNDTTQLFQTSTRTCVCKLYVDDLKLYSIIETNTDLLQDKLNLICSLSNVQWLNISHNKCNVMFNDNASGSPNFLLNNNVSPTADTVKDLSIIVDSPLTFSAHIQNIVTKAFCMLT
jgi:hypothetical protein